MLKKIRQLFCWHSWRKAMFFYGFTCRKCGKQKVSEPEKRVGISSEFVEMYDSFTVASPDFYKKCGEFMEKVYGMRK